MSDGYHWYDPASSSIVEGADLRLAREKHLLPSVTSVLKCWYSYQLESYKQQQIIKAAMASPRRPDESPEEYGPRILEASRRHAEAAADLGQRCHAELHRYNLNAQRGVDRYIFCRELEQCCLPWSDFVEKSGLRIRETEAALAIPALGVAGTLDCVSLDAALGTVIEDFKCSGVKERNGKKNPQFYPYYLHQLSAYAVLYQTKNQLPEPPRVRSHLLDSKGAGLYSKLWSVEDQRRGWKFMQHLIAAWQENFRYNPSLK